MIILNCVKCSKGTRVGRTFLKSDTMRMYEVIKVKDEKNIDVVCITCQKLNKPN